MFHHFATQNDALKQGFPSQTAPFPHWTATNETPGEESQAPGGRRNLSE